jgi:hypothetical protein
MNHLTKPCKGENAIEERNPISSLSTYSANTLVNLVQNVLTPMKRHFSFDQLEVACIADFEQGRLQNQFSIKAYLELILEPG